MPRKSVVIFANDPGTKNYGFSIIRATIVASPRRRISFQILEHGLIVDTLQTLKSGKDAKKEIIAYMKTISSLVQRHEPVVWVAERYMTRGIKGSLIEMVAIMIGAVFGIYHRKMAFRFIIAAEWKNQANKIGNLKAFYKEAKKFGVTPHQVDACFIGIYVAHRLVGLKGFEFLPKNVGQLICQSVR